MIQNIYKRFKKYIIIMLLFPVLTAIAAFLFTMNQPAVYTAKASFSLGNFEAPNYTDPKIVVGQLKKKSYLEYLNQEYDLNLPVEELIEKMSVTEIPGNVVTLSLSSDNIQVKDSIGKLTEAFIEESQNVKKEKEKFILDTIQKIESVDASPEEAISKERFIFDLKKSLIDFKDNVINEQVYVEQTKSDPLKRAVLGFLVGIILNVVFIVTPEILKP
jgi:teichuronic acid biosynthesis protein TuaF